MNCKKLLLAFIAMISISSCASFDHNAVEPNPKVTFATLDNGLYYQIQSKVDLSNVIQLRLRIKSGSLSEAPSQSGYAHLLEHMAFNGTKNFPKNEIITLFEKSGLSFGHDINAFTDYDQTVYTLSIPTSNPKLFEDTVLYLSDILSNIQFSQEELDREKGVVQNELLSFGLTLKEKSFYLSFFNDVLKGSVFEDHLVIGSMESVENAKVDGLNSFYRKWYRPDNAQLLITGDIENKYASSVINKVFSQIKESTAKPLQLKPEPLKFDLTSKTYTSKIITGASSDLIFKLPKKFNSKKFDLVKLLEENLLYDLIEFRLNSDNAKLKAPFKELEVATSELVANEHIQVIAVEHRYEQYKDAVSFVAKELAKVKQYGFTQAEFEQQLALFENYQAELKNNYINATSEQLADRTITAWNNGAYLHTLKSKTEVFDLFLKNITLIKINKLAEEFITLPKKWIYSYPYQSKSPNVNKLNNLFQEEFKRKQKSPDLKFGKLHLPAMNNLSKNQKIVSTKVDHKNNITSFYLSNGVDVVLKPDPSVKNAIVMYLQAPGGINTLQASQLAALRLLIPVYSRSDLLGLSSEELDRELSNNNIYLNVNIDNNSHGFYMECSNNAQGINLLFATIYESFTNAQLTDKYFHLVKKQKIEDLQNYLKLTISTTASKLLNSLYPNNPYQNEMKLKELQAVQAKDLKQIYKHFFSSASGFKLTVVGDFKNKELKPLILKYIANLPSGTTHHFSLLKQSIIKDAISLDEHTNPQEKGEVSFISVVRNQKSGIKSFYEAEILERIIDQKITKVVREDLSLTYSPYVSIGYQTEGTSFTSSTISVLSKVCDVKKTQKVISKILNDFRTDGVTDEQLNDHKNGLIQSMKTEKSNIYDQAYYLSRDQLYGFAFESFELSQKIIGSITKQDLNALIKVAFEPSNILKFTNSPDFNNKK